MSYGFKPIGQYLEDTLNDVPSVTPTQTFGINAIHKFFHPFNNKGVIDEIIEARKRERKIQQKLMADEWGLKVIMGVPTDADAPSTNRPKDGLLITTPQSQFISGCSLTTTTPIMQYILIGETYTRR
eukprot:270092_1